jgi:L-arabinose isomerase
VRAASVAGRLRTARLGVMGAPLDGYLNVVCDPAALERATGAQLVDIPAAEVTEAWRGVGPAEVAALAAAYGARMPLDAATVASPDFRDALRLALALEALVQRHRLDGGAFNCRNEHAVGNTEIGVLGCLALSHLTTHGFPFTCTGDTLTAVAMLLGKHLGGDSLYCELDTPDYARDAVLCANTGEGDFRQAAACAGCRIAVSGQESGRNSRGCSVGYDVDAREGTAIAFTPRAGDPGGHAILFAEGRIEPPPPTGLKLPHLMFRFRGLPVGEGMSRWIAAGATHHAGISSGHHGAALEAVALHLGIGAERVA